MNPFRAVKTMALLACLLWAGGWARAGAAVVNDLENPYDTDDMEVMTRGPVHEAFGTPQSFNPEPGVKAPVAPPQAFEESAPEEMPDDPNAVWIPGYWMWDDDLGDFLWVSGIVRIAPDGLVWVDGYWAETDEGWMRVSGFWQPVETPEVNYAPAPPESLEAGPAYDPPTPDAIWSPGYWEYAPMRWHWTDGYWIRPVPDWIWIPPHWVWTPRGYVHVPGYWDCVPERRAIVFAPIHFRRPIYETPLYVYQPVVTIRIEAIFINLFSRPRCNQYYFGDYYDPDCHRRGYFPWFECETSRRWHDPIFSYARWRHHSEGWSWLDNERRRYDDCRDNRDRRPPHTFRDQLSMFRRGPDARRPEWFLGQPLDQFRDNRIVNKTIVNNQTTEIKFSKDSARRSRMNDEAKDLRKFQDERKQWETSGGTGRQGRNAKKEVAPLSLKTLADAFPNRNRDPGDNNRGNRGRGDRGDYSPGRSTLKTSPPSTPAVLETPASSGKSTRDRLRENRGPKGTTLNAQGPTPTPHGGGDGNRWKSRGPQVGDPDDDRSPTPTPKSGGRDRGRDERSFSPEGQTAGGKRSLETPRPTPRVKGGSYSPKNSGNDSSDRDSVRSDRNSDSKIFRITPTPRALWTPKPIIDYPSGNERRNGNVERKPIVSQDRSTRNIKPVPTPKPTPRPTPRVIDTRNNNQGGGGSWQGGSRNSSRSPVIVATPPAPASQTTSTGGSGSGSSGKSGGDNSKRKGRNDR